MTVPKISSMCRVRTKRSKLCRGFTLIELLVVISIIALLIALILPALGKARESADASVCLSRVRQMMVAQSSYEADNGTLLSPIPKYDYANAQNPNGPIWMETFSNLGYIGTVRGNASPQQFNNFWVCPSARKANHVRTFNTTDLQFFSYMENGWLGDWNKARTVPPYIYPGRKSSMFPNPSRTIAFTERNEVIQLGPGQARNYARFTDWNYSAWQVTHLLKSPTGTHWVPWNAPDLPANTRYSQEGINNIAFLDGSACGVQIRQWRHPLSAGDWGDGQLILWLDIDVQ